MCLRGVAVFLIALLFIVSPFSCQSDEIAFVWFGFFCFKCVGAEFEVIGYLAGGVSGIRLILSFCDLGDITSIILMPINFGYLPKWALFP